MRRRVLLAATGSAYTALAGCLDAFVSEDPDDETGEQSEEPSPERTAQVALSEASYLVGAAPPAEAGKPVVEPDDVKPLGELPEPLADALREASDGGFETDDVSEELLEAVDELRDPGSHHRLSELYVRIDGTDYVAELQLPELEVRLAEETVEGYDPDLKVHRDDEFEHDAVEYLVRRIGWNGSPQTTRSPYRLSSVPAEIEAFLEAYEYVEDFNGVSPIEVERHDWEPPYSIDLRSLEDERWGREVLEAHSLDEELREFIERAVEARIDTSSPPFVTDEIPDAYHETFRPGDEEVDSPFVRVDDEVYHILVSQGDHGRMPLDVTAEGAAPTDDGLARFSLTVDVTDDRAGAEIVTEEPLELHSQIGLPTVLQVSHDGEYHLLKSDRYEFEVTREESEAVGWSLDVDGTDRRELAVSEELSVGDELTATYVVPETIPDGTYIARGTFAAIWQADPDDMTRTDGRFPFELELTVSSS